MTFQTLLSSLGFIGLSCLGLNRVNMSRFEALRSQVIAEEPTLITGLNLTHLVPAELLEEMLGCVQSLVLLSLCQQMSNPFGQSLLEAECFPQCLVDSGHTQSSFACVVYMSEAPVVML